MNAPMQNDQIISDLLADPDKALYAWYESVTPAKGSDLTLTSGAEPSPRRMREAFDLWFARRRDNLRKLICLQLGYSALGKGTRDMSEIALVAAVSSILAASPMADQLDPLATASILVSTRLINKLCDPEGSS